MLRNTNLNLVVLYISKCAFTFYNTAFVSCLFSNLMMIFSSGFVTVHAKVFSKIFEIFLYLISYNF